MTEMTEALYLYAFARPDCVPELQSQGISGAGRIFFEQCGDVCAALSRVPLEDFVGEAAEERLQDLAWVGPRAVMHQRVIEELMEHAPVFPAGFGTLFSSVEGVKRLIEANLPAISEFLARMKDYEEWSVKGLLARNLLMEKMYAEGLAEAGEELAGLTQGVRYFRERQIKARAEKELSAFLKGLISQVADKLTEIVSERRRRDTASRPNDDSGRELVFNWAFLVNRARVDAFNALIDRIANETEASGLTIEASGPWPPFSFCPALAMEDDA